MQTEVYTHGYSCFGVLAEGSNFIIPGVWVPRPRRWRTAQIPSRSGVWFPGSLSAVHPQRRKVGSVPASCMVCLGESHDRREAWLTLRSREMLETEASENTHRMSKVNYTQEMSAAAAHLACDLKDKYLGTHC